MHSEEMLFYSSDAESINQKYAGKHIAIVGRKIVASGNDPREVWLEAKKKFPHKQPVLAFVPKPDTLVLVF